MAEGGTKKKVYLFKSPSSEEEKDMFLRSDRMPAPQSPIQDKDKYRNPMELMIQQFGEFELKVEEPQDRYVQHLEGNGIESEVVPIISFNFCNTRDLWKRLKTPENYAGLIFTSGRCVQAIHEAMLATFQGEKEWNEKLMLEWASKYLFCVGPSTVNKTETLFTHPKSKLTLNILEGEQANAESLAGRIIQVNESDALTLPLLYPCGSMKRDVLQTKLREAKIEVAVCIAYETLKSPGVERQVKDICKAAANHLAYFCFFSPSGVRFAFEDLDLEVIKREHTTLVSIGQTTKSALEAVLAQHQIQKPVYACESPTPEALLDVVLNA